MEIIFTLGGSVTVEGAADVTGEEVIGGATEVSAVVVAGNVEGTARLGAVAGAVSDSAVASSS